MLTKTLLSTVLLQLLPICAGGRRDQGCQAAPRCRRKPAGVRMRAESQSEIDVAIGSLAVGASLFGGYGGESNTGEHRIFRFGPWQELRRKHMTMFFISI